MSPTSAVLSGLSASVVKSAAAAGHVTLDDVRELVGDADPEEVLRVVRGLGRIIARAILRGKALTTETRRARRRSEA